jgi:hypothetical protein
MNHHSDIPRWMQASAAATVAAIAVTAFGVDLFNNLTFGLRVSPMAGVIFGAAAAGVFAFPCVAAIYGWNRLWVMCTVMSLILTVVAGGGSYLASHGDIILASKGASQKYDNAQADAHSAREEARTARAEAAAVKELASVEALKAIVDTAKQTAKDRSGQAKDGGVLCTAIKKCVDAQNSVTAAITRLGEAETKAAALKRADDADNKAKIADGRTAKGPSGASLNGVFVGKMLGVDAYTGDEYFDAALTVITLLTTITFALSGHTAVDLFASMSSPTAPTESKPVEEVEAPKVAMNKKSQTLLRLQLLAYNSPGHQYVSSQRKLADELNVKRSTFSEWLSQWQASGLIEVSSFGRKTKFSAPRKRVA